MDAKMPPNEFNRGTKIKLSSDFIIRKIKNKERKRVIKDIMVIYFILSIP